MKEVQLNTAIGCKNTLEFFPPSTTIVQLFQEALMTGLWQGLGGTRWQKEILSHIPGVAIVFCMHSFKASVKAEYVVTKNENSMVNCQ